MEILALKVPENLTFAEISGYMGWLSPARRKSIEKKKNEGDKINALLSRLLILSEISQRTGLSEKKISFRKGSQGKPYLKNSELQFSLSHTKGAIAAGFGDIMELGVDIERKSRKINPSLYGRTLSAGELEKTHSDEDFLRFWVRKEAFLKRLGLGIAHDLKEINTLVVPDTAVYEWDDFFIGASGEGAESAAVKEISLDELLGRFVKML